LGTMSFPPQVWPMPSYGFGWGSLVHQHMEALPQLSYTSTLRSAQLRTGMPTSPTYATFDYMPQAWGVVPQLGSIRISDMPMHTESPTTFSAQTNSRQYVCPPAPTTCMHCGWTCRCMDGKTDIIRRGHQSTTTDTQQVESDALVPPEDEVITSTAQVSDDTQGKVSRLLKDAEFGDESHKCEEAPEPETLRIWTGVLRLESEIPSDESLRAILYNDANNSAKDADVVALFIMDIRDKKSRLQGYQHFFSKLLLDASEYFFNETDEGLLIPHVPALRLNPEDSEERFAALCVAVHKRHVVDVDNDGSICHHDVFPFPPHLTARAQVHSGKLELKRDSDSYAIQQDVCLGHHVQLKLLGVNLDPDPNAQISQLEEIHRDFYFAGRTGFKTAAVIFGDFEDRLVATDQYSRLLSSSEDTLSTRGICSLIDKVRHPNKRRELLLNASSCTFSGYGAYGKHHDPCAAAQRLRSMFDTHLDFLRDHPELPVPLPTYPRQPVCDRFTQDLGYKVKIDGLLTRDQVHDMVDTLTALQPSLFPDCRFSNRLSDAEIADFVAHWYFTHDVQTEIQTKFGPAVQLQCGWLDGVGVYKNSSVKSELLTFNADHSILSFDHCPVKGVVKIHKGENGLRVWVGCIKLDNRFPDFETLQSFMYGNLSCSAQGADVIALYFTDLSLEGEDTVEPVRHLLKKVVPNPSEYIFNTDDPGLGLQGIPAIFVNTKGSDRRYVAMFCCVHERWVGDLDQNQKTDFEDVFPKPAQLQCRSSLKNLFAPNFKAHMTQEIQLYDGKEFFRLLLFGLNFDTKDKAQLVQVNALQRIYSDMGRCGIPFTSIVFGDFNNRLVCTKEMMDNGWVDQGKPGKPGKPSKMKLNKKGISSLWALLANKESRRDLWLNKDVWSWTGTDAAGNTITKPPEAFQKLAEMFQMPRDLVAAHPNHAIPLPTYKKTPVNDILTAAVGLKCEIWSLLTIEKMRASFIALDFENLENLIELQTDTTSHDQVLDTFFEGHVKKPVPILRKLRPFPVFDIGWPDGIGVYKCGPLKTRIVNWGSASGLASGKHVPTRATVLLTMPLEQ